MRKVIFHGKILNFGGVSSRQLGYLELKMVTVKNILWMNI